MSPWHLLADALHNHLNILRLLPSDNLADKEVVQPVGEELVGTNLLPIESARPGCHRDIREGTAVKDSKDRTGLVRMSRSGGLLSVTAGVSLFYNFASSDMPSRAQIVSLTRTQIDPAGSGVQACHENQVSVIIYKTKGDRDRILTSSRHKSRSRSSY